MYAVANNAVLAKRYGAMLAVGSPVVRATFNATRGLPHKCQNAREWSGPAFRHNVSTRWWYWDCVYTQQRRPSAMHDLFAGQYRPWVQHELQRIKSTLPQMYTVIHLRTGAEFHCKTKLVTGGCGQCLPPRTLRCVHESVLGETALLFTDFDPGEMRRRIESTRAGKGPLHVLYRTEDEVFPAGLDLINFSLSTSSSKRTLAGVLWALAYEAPLFIGSASSTLSKSVAMARLDHKPTILVDMRCHRGRGDEQLYGCRTASLAHLVDKNLARAGTKPNSRLARSCVPKN